MTRMKLLLAALGVAFLAASPWAEAAPIVSPSLDGTRGSITQGFAAFDADTTVAFAFDLTGPAAADLRLDFASPGAFGQPVSSAAVSLSGPGTSTGTMALMSGDSLRFAASLFANVGTYMLNFDVTGAAGASGTLKTFEYGLTTTPLPAGMALMVPALAGLGVMGWRRRDRAV